MSHSPLHKPKYFAQKRSTTLRIGLLITLIALVFVLGACKKAPSTTSQNSSTKPAKTQPSQTPAEQPTTDQTAKEDTSSQCPTLKNDTWTALLKLKKYDYFLGVDGQNNLYVVRNYKEILQYQPNGTLARTITFDDAHKNYSVSSGTVMRNGNVAVIAEPNEDSAEGSLTLLGTFSNKNKLTAVAQTKAKEVATVVAAENILYWDEIDGEGTPVTKSANMEQPKSAVKIVRRDTSEEPLYLDSYVTEGVLSFTNGQTSILFDVAKKKELARKALYATNELIYFDGKTHAYVSPEGEGLGEWIAIDGLRLPSAKRLAKTVLDEKFTLKKGYVVAPGGMANAALSNHSKSSEERVLFGQAFAVNKDYSYIVARYCK